MSWPPCSIYTLVKWVLYRWTTGRATLAVVLIPSDRGNSHNVVNFLFDTSGWAIFNAVVYIPLDLWGTIHPTVYIPFSVS